MKLKVVSTFKDKFTGEIYPVGSEVEIKDGDRVEDLVERQLAVVVKVVNNDSAKVSVFGAEFDKKTLVDAMKAAGVSVNANTGEQKLVEKIATLSPEELNAVKSALGVEPEPEPKA